MIDRGLMRNGGWYALRRGTRAAGRRRACWTALLCLALTSALIARGFAADPAPPSNAAPPVHQAAPVAQKAAPAAKEAVLVRAAGNQILVLTPAQPPAAQKAAPATKKGAPATITMHAARPAKPAANRGSLLGAIVNVLGGDVDGTRQAAMQQQQQAMQDQQLRQWEANFRPQFEQMLYAELAFVRRSCKPDAKPFAEVAKAAKADLRAPIRQYVCAVYMPQMRPQLPGNANETSDNPRQAMQKWLTTLVEAKLGREKVRLYRDECGKRAEARKHAVIQNLVAAVDDRLVLTAAQRANWSIRSRRNTRTRGKTTSSTSPITPNTCRRCPNRRSFPCWRRSRKAYGARLRGRTARWRFGFAFNNGGQFGEEQEVQEISRMVQDVEVKNDK